MGESEPLELTLGVEGRQPEGTCPLAGGVWLVGKANERGRLGRRKAA
jgi:hypothetical protein